MNNNTPAYPNGRWTARRREPASNPAPPPPGSGPQPSLQELFWGAPDLQMLADTRGHIERLLAAAGATDTLQDAEPENTSPATGTEWDVEWNLAVQ